MNAPSALGKIEQIRARDGDACWLCTLPLDFQAVRGSKNAPTIEHLVAKSLGGGGELSNLALTHSGCNGHLADRPLAKKQELRAKWHANAARNAVTKAAAAAQAPAAKPRAEALTVKPAAKPVATVHPNLPGEACSKMQDEIAYWRRLALISGGGLLLSIGFAIGLCAGLLLS